MNKNKTNAIQWLRENWDFWFACFLVFSVIGWVYELGVFALEFHEGLINRGFLFGPYLPIYGIGGLLTIFLLSRVKDKRLTVLGISVTPLLCFVYIVGITTTVELIGSYLMEWGMGRWLWDYTNYGINFQGRIAVRSSLRFGIMGMAGLYIVHPMMEKLRARFSRSAAYRIGIRLAAAVFTLDLLARFFLGSNA